MNTRDTHQIVIMKSSYGENRVKEVLRWDGWCVEPSEGPDVPFRFLGVAALLPLLSLVSGVKTTSILLSIPTPSRSYPSTGVYTTQPLDAVRWLHVETRSYQSFRLKLRSMP